MGRARLNGQSGGLKINGVEADCIVMSGQTITKGDFVEFVRSTVSTPTTNLLGTTFTIGDVSTVKLTEEQIFVVYFNTADYFHYGIVLQRSGDTFVNLTPTAIKVSTNVCSQGMFLEKISDTKVVLHYVLTSQAKYVVVMSFNGTAITVGTHYLFASSTAIYAQGIAVYDETHVIVFYYSGSGFYAEVLTISGNTITNRAGSVTIYASAAVTTMSFRKLASGKIFVVGAAGNGYLGYCFLTLSGTTLTSSSFTLLVTCNAFSPLFMSDSLVYIMYTPAPYVGTLFVNKVSINDALSTATLIGSESFVTDVYSSNMSAVALSDTKILFTYNKQSNNYPSVAVVDISSGSFRQEFSTYLHNGISYLMSKIIRRSSKIGDLFFRGSNNYFYSKVVRIEEYGKTSSIIEKCNAVAKSGGSSLQSIKVIKLTGGL